MQTMWSVNSRDELQKLDIECLKFNTDKTELVWTGSKYNTSSLADCMLSYCNSTAPSDGVRLLGMTTAAGFSNPLTPSGATWVQL